MECSVYSEFPVSVGLTLPHRCGAFRRYTPVNTALVGAPSSDIDGRFGAAPQGSLGRVRDVSLGGTARAVTGKEACCH